MTKLNLLPIQDLENAFKKRIFIMMVMMVFACGTLIIFVCTHYLNFQISNQVVKIARVKDNLEKMQTDILELDNLNLRKAKIIKSIEIMQSLNQARYSLLSLFNILIETMPDSVYLKEIERKSNLVKIQGMASSNGGVMDLLKKLRNAQEVSNIKLGEAVFNKDEMLQNFKIELLQKWDKNEE